MVLTPVMSRVRATAVVSGGAAMVCLAGVGFTALPATQPASSGPSAALASEASASSVRLVAQVTPLPASRSASRVLASGGLGGGPGGGSGGGSDGSAGDAVAPSPAKHASSGGSSSSSSTASGASGGHGSSAESPGLVSGIFKHVGHWLGLSSDDSKASGDSVSNAPKPAKPAGAGSGKAGSDGSGGASAPGGKSADASDAGGVIHSVFAGIGRLFSGLFG
ncbi:MAG TPA: hypothetical protein VH141_30855 [Pseudonocardia sp.]|jgi:hypothetical protein|nr:hypothetical protein [Pseudonocardia sp.]